MHDAHTDEKPAQKVDNDDYRFGAPPKDLPKLEPAPETRSTKRGAVRVEIVDLRDKGHRKRFLDVADSIQSGDPNYISPLRMERMKFLDVAHNKSLASLELRPAPRERREGLARRPRGRRSCPDRGVRSDGLGPVRSRRRGKGAVWWRSPRG